MVEKTFEIVWTRRSQQHIKQLFDYIRADSVKSAGKVVKVIVSSVEKAKLNPVLYNANKYKNN